MDSDTKTWDRLYQLLAADNSDQLVYVYRVDSIGNVRKRYLFCLMMQEDLIENIRDKYGGGEYRLLIRHGRKMVFSGFICLAPPPSPRRNTAWT